MTMLVEPQRETIPALNSGDQLSRREFERRYAAMQAHVKAELIEGVVYVMASPVRVEKHGEPHSWMNTWLGVYTAYTPGVRIADNVTIRLDVDNEYQPDIVVRLEPACGGASSITPDDYLEGAPELVVEIAGSSASIDLRDKLRVYRRNGVREYMVWQTHDNQLDWWELHDDEYVPLVPDAQGVVRSRVFPGLWLDRAALLKGDLATVLAQLQQGLSSKEHNAFAQQNQHMCASG
ncbi:MAG: Uma2 family endonuclease [Chloroflexaceae bacterium]|jgi:Uma2 family endonuclease|nr:Uma2 family endonuclease [Chloroflexaceae bacterium]